MSFINIDYFVFIAIGVILYYALPKRCQWVVLLAMSYVYYLSFNVKAVVFILFTTIVVYLAARLMDSMEAKQKEYLAANKETLDKETKKAYKAATKRRKKIVLIVTMVVNFGILCFVKGANFVLENVNHLTGSNYNMLKILVPLGISYYTFMVVGYLLDVYWGKVQAEKNPFKFALFVSFFPQILQGPIGRFDRLSHQFYEGHKFDLEQIQYGLQRIFWGFFKKLVIADRAAVYVNEVLVNNYANYDGIVVLGGLLMWSIQLYADFSGGIDMVIGSAQLFGIKLDENFRQPYFSKSIGEFWRRWHITLGTWMKDYIFYPFSLSKTFSNMSKFFKKLFGKQVGTAIPIGLADLLIFFIVGIWHGFSWKCVAYGMYNGIILAFSAVAKPAYKKGLELCHINGEGKAWGLFMMLRTFILVNIGWYFDMPVSLSASATLIRNTFNNFTFSVFGSGIFTGMGLKVRDYAIIFAGCVIIFIVSVLKEKGVHIRKAVADKPLLVRWVLYLALVFAPILFGYTEATSGFLYAQF